ncbi:helix-turn-helix domain-containing protein [Candidatus Uhrbacteria bacterium]|nr:helix-turn-helix domain-containing protein [Candidatus Uhrbacteria bacterium]
MTNSNGQSGQRLLTVKQLAALLTVSTTSIYRLVEHREIPFFRLPHGLRFDEADVSEFLKQRRVEAVD